MRHAVTRSERRLEKRQTTVLLMLALALVAVSFALGVMVGRSTADRAAAVAQPRPETHPLPQPPTAGKAELTFYDALPKGERAPLGSGINLPPGSTAPAPSAEAPATPPPSPLPEPAAPAVAATASPAPPPAAPSAAPVKAPPAAVKPVAKPPEPKPATAPAKAPPTTAAGDFVVQAAAFRTAADARAVQAKLAGKGYPCYTQEANLGEKGVWYRVFVGPYGSAASAEAASKRLKSEERLSGMVKKR